MKELIVVLITVAALYVLAGIGGLEWKELYL